VRLAVSVVIPAYQEHQVIGWVVERILGSVQSEVEVLVVVDDADDSTLRALESSAEDDRVRPLVSSYGPGPANAIRFGIDSASHPIVAVTMADGSDDPQQIDPLARLVDRGVVIAAASRYSAGGQHVGGPLLKSTLSRVAGVSLGLIGRAGTYDATNSFKAYSRDFVRAVGIDSRSGFEIGLELTAKARRLRLPVAELPTIWLERTEGESRFRLREWVPRYLRWYAFAYGPRLTLEQVRAASARIAVVNAHEES
jgi:glycosyltransferase involved in cell wall biosynthesis